MTSALRTVSVYRAADDIPPDVDKLFRSAERANVQFGMAWYRNLVDTALAAQGDIFFYVLRDAAGRPVAALPIVVTRRRWPRSGSVASLSNFYTGLFAPALAPEATAHDLARLIAALVTAHYPLGSLRFAPMDPQSQAYALLWNALRIAGMKPFGFFCFGNWFLPVRMPWADYLKNREGAVRSTIKRMGKKFAAAGGRLELITGAERLAYGLDAYQTVYAASWKNAEPYPQFMPGLMRLCAERGWLRLAVATLEGRAVAAQIWIVAHGRAEVYKLAYDEDFKAYSPGTLLTTLLMQYVFETDQVGEVDYLIGDDPYKKAWMSERRERWGIIAYNPRTLGGFGGWSREALGRALKPLALKLGSRLRRSAVA